MNSIQISIVIPTHNRADLLAQVLETLCNQAVAPTTYEVIVVDNRSTDNTRAIGEEFQRKHANVRYYLETELGLTQARNRGWQEAAGSYVAFTDDDCKFPPQWTAIAQEIIKEKHPGIFGGPYYPFYSTPKPVWFKDSYGSSAIMGDARELSEDEFLSGGNIVFERELIAELGGFRKDMGMKGNKLAYGEETALLVHTRETRPETMIYFDPRLYLFHLVRPEKMSWPYIMRNRFVRGADTYRVFEEDRQSTPQWPGIMRRAGTNLGKILVDGLLSVWLRDRDQYPFMQNYWYEHSLSYVASLGAVLAQAQMRSRKVDRERLEATDSQQHISG